MRKTMSRALLAGLLCGVAAAAFSQFPPMPFRTGGMGNSGDSDKSYLEKLKKENPDLYKFENRISEIHNEIREILIKYADKKMEKSAAKDALVPLMKEERDIRNDPGYLAEQSLSLAPMMKAPMPAMLTPVKPATAAGGK
jgi:hypothetical protein